MSLKALKQNIFRCSPNFVWQFEFCVHTWCLTKTYLPPQTCMTGLSEYVVVLAKRPESIEKNLKKNTNL